MPKLLQGRECNLTFAEVKEHCLKNWSEFEFKQKSNFKALNNVLNDQWGSDWSGGSYEDLKEQLNSGVKDFDKWVAQSINSIQIETKRPKRKKYWSDISGDIDMDRRWEDRPYQAITRVPTETHIIHLYVNANFNGMVTAQSINAYGIQVYRALNALEAAGRTVDLTVYFTSTYMYQKLSGKVLMLVKIKQPGEYINSANLALTLTPIFLRKAIFHEECLFAEKIDDVINSGHGSAANQLRRNVTIAGDEVYIEPMNLTSFGDSDIQGILKELLGEDKVA